MLEGSLQTQDEQSGARARLDLPNAQIHASKHCSAVRATATCIGRGSGNSECNLPTPRAASFGQSMPDWISSFGIAVPHLPNGPCSYIVYTWAPQIHIWEPLWALSIWDIPTWNLWFLLVLKRQRGECKRTWNNCRVSSLALDELYDLEAYTRTPAVSSSNARKSLKLIAWSEVWGGAGLGFLLVSCSCRVPLLTRKNGLGTSHD